MESLEKICVKLNCNVEDVMSFIEGENDNGIE